MKSFIIPLVVLTAACAASSQPPPAASATTTASEHAGPPHEKAHHAHGEGHEHADLVPALKDFHGVIAPVWHSEPGATRIEKACASTKPMAEKAQATNDAELVAAVAALEGACVKEGRAEVEAKLAAVHDRFHAVAKIEKHDEKH